MVNFFYLKDMLERFTSIFRRPGKAQECTITDANFPRKLAAKYASQLVPPGDVDQVIDGVDCFISDLSGIESVQALAFLAVRHPHCPMTLSSVVFFPFIPGDASATRDFDAVGIADATFASRLENLLLISLRFVNTADVSPDTLRAPLIQRWSADPTLELLHFVRFSHG